MLVSRIKKIQTLPVMEKVLRFFDSSVYACVYGAIALICSFLGFELAFFILTTVAVVFTTVFSKDSKPLVVPLVLVVYSMSQKHTPQHPYLSDYLYTPYVLITMGVLALLICASFIFRLICFRTENSVFKSKPVAFWGLLVFCLALILNGIFYNKYTPYNLILGIILSCSFVFFYIYFFNTLEYNKTTGKYIAEILVVACGVILIQILEMFVFDGVIKNGSIDKHVLNLGWGMSNNIGGMLTMFMPAAFYLAYTHKNKWIGRSYYLFGFIILIGVALTLSRTSFLVGGFVLVSIMILMSLKGADVKFFRIFNIICLILGVLLTVIFFDKLVEIFKHYLDKGFDDSERFFIWENGFLNFIKAPVFGVGFYTPLAPEWSYDIENWFFPDMYHNTFIQLLASCGIVGVAAYVYHLVQAGFLFLKKITVERLFYFFVVAALTLMCMFDNHIFHIFPTLVYSMLFAVAEKDYKHIVQNDIEKVNSTQKM